MDAQKVSKKPFRSSRAHMSTRRACDTCRRRKTKCAGDKPHCERYQQTQGFKVSNKKHAESYSCDKTKDFAFSSLSNTRSVFMWNLYDDSDSTDSNRSTHSSPSDSSSYDAFSSSSHSSTEITHLCDIFFDRLGSIFPFLDRISFKKEMEDNTIEPAIVHAICAISTIEMCNTCIVTDEESCCGTSEHIECKIRSQQNMDIVRCLVFERSDDPIVYMIQTCILSAYAEFGLENCSAARIYLGLAIQGLDQIRAQLKQNDTRSHPSNLQALRAGNAEPFLGRLHQRLRGKFHIHEVVADLCDIESHYNVRALYDSIDLIAQALPFRIPMPLPHNSGNGYWDSLVAIGHALVTESVEPYPILISMIRLHGFLMDIKRKNKAGTYITGNEEEIFTFHGQCLVKLENSLLPELRFSLVNLERHIQIQRGTSFILMHLWLQANIIISHQPCFQQMPRNTFNSVSQENLKVCRSAATSIATIVDTTTIVDKSKIKDLAFASKPIFTACCVFMVEFIRSRYSASQQQYRGHQSAFTEWLSHAEAENSQEEVLRAQCRFSWLYTALQNVCSRWRSCSHLMQILLPVEAEQQSVVAPLTALSRNSSLEQCC